MAKIEAHQEPRFIQEQYDLLKRCAKKRDMSEWNQWRKDNPGVEILLEGIAPFEGTFLESADFHHANLTGANFFGSNLKGANFFSANMQNAVFNGTNLKNANFATGETHLEGASFMSSNLRGADLTGANLQRCNFIKANMVDATLDCSDLEEAIFSEANLKKVDLSGANLKGAIFKLAIVDTGTVAQFCNFDNRTDFSGVGLDASRVQPGLKVALKNNIRRIHWQRWLNKERKKEKWMVPWLWPWPVMLFWWVTDYGSSTKRIIGTFFALATAFCLIYWLLAMVPGSQSVIDELRQVPGSDSSKPAITFGCMHTLVRSFYFSVVTMTTLGFGDMHAAKTGGWPSCVGYVLLTLQVLLGYVFLGALVTRLGILFTGEAPAAEPTSSKTKEIKQE